MLGSFLRQPSHDELALYELTGSKVYLGGSRTNERLCPQDAEPEDSFDASEEDNKTHNKTIFESLGEQEPSRFENDAFNRIQSPHSITKYR